MKNKALKINDWPFEKNEKAKLVWIGEPFKEKKKWMIYAYFRSNRGTKSIKMDWATIHFLSLNKIYQDGYLNKADIPKNTKTIEINLDNAEVKYNERDWKIQGTDIKTKSKTFNFNKNDKVYTVPIIEVIRTVLAPDRFMLNLILSLDTIENYLTYDMQNKVMDLYFTSEYEKNLLRNEKINHLAWILSNDEIMRIIGDISNSVSVIGGGELKFNFLLSRFRIKARVEEKDKFVKVQEILGVQSKRMDVREINVYHPRLEKIAEGNQAKKREYVTRESCKDRELSNEADGSKNESELIQTNLIEHEYIQDSKINRKTTGKTQKRSYSDENTIRYLAEDMGKRTTGDVGGGDTLRGIEFANLSDITIKGELEEFIEILRLLDLKPNIVKIEIIIIINYLPEIKGYKFERLRDGITRRRYVIGRITMPNGKENSLIEIEREGKSLSMLLLQANRGVNWKWMYSELLIGLVKESGKWSNEIIEKIQQMKIVVIRNKHLKKCAIERASHIYEKL